MKVKKNHMNKQIFALKKAFQMKYKNQRCFKKHDHDNYSGGNISNAVFQNSLRRTFVL